MKATLHTDGAARRKLGEPTGPAGIGAVLRSESGVVIGEIARCIGVATNNVAEYTALIEGLRMTLDRGVTDLDAYIDSPVVEGHLLRGHRVKASHLVPLVGCVRKLLALFSTTSLTRVPRALNADADRLANLGIDKAIRQSAAPDNAGMNRPPGDGLRVMYGMTGILTLPPEKGGITDLLCDMDECFCPRGRAYFERISKALLGKPMSEWIPTDDHFPKSRECGGELRPGNVRLAHKLCNAYHHGTGSGRDRMRQKKRKEKEEWLRGHPEWTATIAAADEQWVASRNRTTVPGLGEVTAHLMSFDGALLERGYWLYVWRIVAGSETFLYVGQTGDRSSPHASSPLQGVGRDLEVGPNAKIDPMSKELEARGIDLTTCTFRLLAIGPIPPEQPDVGQHELFRGLVAAQETALAGLLCTRGYKVISKHVPRVYDRGLFTRVCDLIATQFPAL